MSSKYNFTAVIWHNVRLARSFVTGPPTQYSVEEPAVASVVVCNTPRRACRRLNPRRPGDDVMPPPV